VWTVARVGSAMLIAKKKHKTIAILDNAIVDEVVKERRKTTKEALR
jgi:hypothetical protein